MTFSPELSKAFVKAHGAMPKLIKDSKNPHFKSEYASLAAVIDAIRKPLADSGLALYQSATTVSDDGGKMFVVVKSILIHESGDCIEDELPMPIAKNDAQGIGSAITYGRRYAAMAICGLAPDDDDGNEASQPQQAQKAVTNGKPAQKPQAKAQPKDLDPDATRKAFHATGTELFGDLWDTARPLVVERYTTNKTPDNKRTSSSDLTPAELAEISGTFKSAAKGWKEWIETTMAEKQPA